MIEDIRKKFSYLQGIFIRSWSFLTAKLVKDPLQCRIPWFDSWIGKIRWRRDRLPTPVFLGFSCGSAGKESACSVGDLGSIPGLGRSPGEGKGYPLQCSGLENYMDSVVHGVAKSWTQLSNFHFIRSYGPSLLLLFFIHCDDFCGMSVQLDYSPQLFDHTLTYMLLWKFVQMKLKSLIN